MHPNIEKLINIAKECGELSEKQKEIILRKAKECGEDVDEVEVLLETISTRQLNQTETHKGTITQKMDLEGTAGDLKVPSATNKMRKCPRCGAYVPDTKMQCPECGYLFSSTDANKNVSFLFDEIKKAKSFSAQKRIIESFPIPNAKVDLLEFLLLSLPRINGRKDKLSSAYFKKYAECIGRSKQYFPDDHDFDEYILVYERKLQILKTKKRKQTILWLSILVLLISIPIALILFPQLKKRQEVSRFEKIVKTGVLSEAKKAYPKLLQEIQEGNISGERIANSITSEINHLIENDNKDDNSDMYRVDTLMTLLSSLPEELQFKSDSKRYDFAIAVSDFYLDHNNVVGIYDALKIYDYVNKNDPNILTHYILSNITFDLMNGYKNAARRDLEMGVGLYLQHAPDVVKQTINEIGNKKIEEATDFVTFGYGLYSIADQTVAIIKQGTSAEAMGVQVGDVLEFREVAPTWKKMRESAGSGKKYLHRFRKKDGTLYSVELEYSVEKLFDQ